MQEPMSGAAVALRPKAIGIRFASLQLQWGKRHFVRESGVLSFLQFLDAMCYTSYGQHLCEWSHRQSFIPQEAAPLPGLLGSLVLCTRIIDTCGLSMAALDASCQVDVCMLACRQSLFPALTHACSCVCLHRIHTEPRLEALASVRMILMERLKSSSKFAWSKRLSML